MTAANLEDLIVVLAGLWIITACGVAMYANAKGLPWFPILIVGLFIPFPIVLLAVVIAAGPRSRTPVTAARPRVASPPSVTVPPDFDETLQFRSRYQ